jgi:hypothetical protein
MLKPYTMSLHLFTTAGKVLYNAEGASPAEFFL